MKITNGTKEVKCLDEILFESPVIISMYHALNDLELLINHDNNKSKSYPISVRYLYIFLNGMPQCDDDISEWINAFGTKSIIKTYDHNYLSDFKDINCYYLTISGAMKICYEIKSDESMACVLYLRELKKKQENANLLKEMLK